MSDNRRNIKVSDEQFEQLKADKPDGMTWGYYLLQLQEDSNNA